jgi:multiple sugar transport system permease protein
MLLNISLMLFPYQVTMVPTFVLMSKLHWIGTWLPGVVPFAFAASPWYVFLLRQFFRAIPEELSDAARIDGCGDLGILSRIILPLSKPVLALMVATHVTWCWNELLFPLLYFKDEQHRTLTLAMQNFIQARGATDWGPMMAMALLIALPMVFVYHSSATIRSVLRPQRHHRIAGQRDAQRYRALARAFCDNEVQYGEQADRGRQPVVESQLRVDERGRDRVGPSRLQLPLEKRAPR